ncbi:MAG: hypothetical protein AB7V46_18550 [Thermomicrobiales bacterium]
MRALQLRPAGFGRLVAVLNSDNGAARVTVIPAKPTDPHPRIFADADDARMFAAGLGLALGATVEDLTRRAM